MRKNDFCVNDKVVGSCWGTVTTFEELDAKKKDDSLGGNHEILPRNNRENNGEDFHGWSNPEIVGWMRVSMHDGS